MGTESESNKNGDGKNDASSEQNKNLYENRPGMKKLIRILTVLAYLVSVSFVAIVLSAYYVFLWQPPNSKLIMHAQTSNEIHAEYLIDNNPSNHFKISSNTRDDVRSFKSDDKFFNQTNYSHKRREVSKQLNSVNEEENATKIIKESLEKIGNSTEKMEILTDKFQNLTIFLNKSNDLATLNYSMDKKSNNNDDTKKNLTKDENIDEKKWKKKFLNYHGIVRGMSNRNIVNVDKGFHDLSTASTVNQSLDPLKMIKGVLEDEKVSYKSNDGTFLDKLKASYASFVEEDENLQDVVDPTSGTPATSSSSMEQDDDDDEDFSDELGNRPEFEGELSPHR